MNSDDDLPSALDLLVWGKHHPRVLTALSRAQLPPGVRWSAGPMGAAVTIPLSTPSEWMELLIGRLERGILEGGLQVGLLPDRPLNGIQLREEWASAVRTRKIPVRLSPREPSETVPVAWEFGDWEFGDFF